MKTYRAKDGTVFVSHDAGGVPQAAVEAAADQIRLLAPRDSTLALAVSGKAVGLITAKLWGRAVRYDVSFGGFGFHVDLPIGLPQDGADEKAALRQELADLKKSAAATAAENRIAREVFRAVLRTVGLLEGADAIVVLNRLADLKTSSDLLDWARLYPSLARQACLETYPAQAPAGRPPEFDLRAALRRAHDSQVNP